MKVIFSFLTCLFIATGCFSQGIDPAAKQILDQFSAKIKTFKTIQVVFTLQIQDAQGNTQGTKKGTVFMKGGKYNLQMAGQEMYCDGKTIWTYDKAANEVTITKYDPSSTTISPQKLFTNFYDKDFLYKVNGEQKIGTKTVIEIEMTPVDKTLNFHKVYLYMDKNSHLLNSGKVLDKSGSRYLYAINNLSGVSTYPESNFTFDKSKHPGVETVNLTQ